MGYASTSGSFGASNINGVGRAWGWGSATSSNGKTINFGEKSKVIEPHLEIREVETIDLFGIDKKDATSLLGKESTDKTKAQEQFGREIDLFDLSNKSKTSKNTPLVQVSKPVVVNDNLIEEQSMVLEPEIAEETNIISSFRQRMANKIVELKEKFANRFGSRNVETSTITKTDNVLDTDVTLAEENFPIVGDSSIVSYDIDFSVEENLLGTSAVDNIDPIFGSDSVETYLITNTSLSSENLFRSSSSSSYSGF
ncbi:MAG: hypothetical protein AAGF07_04405 [Patescibacteria group bacterium]